MGERMKTKRRQRIVHTRLITQAEIARLGGITPREARAIAMRYPHVMIGSTVHVPPWIHDPSRAAERDVHMAELLTQARMRLRPGDCLGPRECTYVLHAPAVGLVKIGQTRRIKHRLAGLAAASPVPLVLIAQFNGRDVERHMHTAFCEHRSHSEWFHEAPVLAFLEEVRRG